MTFDIDQFILDGENFFENSTYQQARTFTDFHDPNEVFSFHDNDMIIMYAPDDNELIKKLVGYRGYNFITITERTNIKKIWHNRNNNTIEISGGDHNRRMRAMNLLRKKLHYYIKGLKKKKLVLPRNMYYFNGQPFFTPSYISENY